MGMCKVCNEVFGTIELTDGVCKNCPTPTLEKKEKSIQNTNLMECDTCGGKISKNIKACPHCGEDGGASEVHAKEFIHAESKSRTVSFVLTVLLGPLGLIYSSLTWGIILTLVAMLGAMTIFIPVIIWIIAIIAGDSATYNHNKKIKNQAKFIK